MLADRDQIGSERIELCSSGLEDVRNRGRETHPDALVPIDSAEQPDNNEEIWDAILEATGSRGRESTSVRPRTGSARG